MNEYAAPPAHSPTVKSPLFNTVPVANDAPPPVIIVGLPHSGTTYLGNVVSWVDDIYVFDDLYACQQAQILGIDGPMSNAQLAHFVGYLTIRLTKRIVNQDGAEDPYFCPRLTEDDAERFRSAMLSTFTGKNPSWPTVTREWLYRLALHHGCRRWGYKTPQDVLQLRKLARLFPNARFIYMTRDPRVVVRNFRCLRTRDGSIRRYHPFASARYWKKSYERYRRFRNTGEAPILLVRYEDLVKSPQATAQTIAGFVGTKLKRDVPKANTDTAFKDKNLRELTPTEMWIVQCVTAKFMREANYIFESCGPRFEDYPDLFRSTWRFGRYQVNRYAQLPRARNQLKHSLRALFSRT